MKMLDGEGYYSKLDTVAKDVLELSSETIDVNTIFLASKINNFIIKAFNRQSLLLKEGDHTPFSDVLGRLVVENESEPLVIPNLRENPLTFNHPVTMKIGNGCFLGVPIFKGNRDIYSTLCAIES
ncbi:hypothetical protein [Jeotgalibacillus soli]|uniref:GAF domain-containing protein n=1 Tax=Jeotgalibacillus soli TaxID=889306 RepID=A0A0C2VKT6_9BACL|nr:hypothetical protein [Jeotgalibacillus soli]KIL44588.1 hypothetical protein KP78_35520 [Jeotgalibacillus soli]